MDQASEFCYSKNKKLAENFFMGAVFWGNSNCLHLEKCRKWSPISDFQQGYLKNYWVLENITGFLFSWHRGLQKFRKRFWLLLHKPKLFGARPLLEKKAIYVKMSDAVNNFALQIHTENNQQLSL
jgi:hypothetical protein